MAQENEDRLYQIAAMQSGYFTAKQANEAGIRYTNHTYHVTSGAWIREWRGIYRLARFPVPDDGHYALWSLWSCNREGIPQGVYSHETALSMFEISDVNPAKIHMTVPPGFRKSAEVPNVLRLHRGTVEKTDCEERFGYRVMKPLPAILVMIREEKVSNEILIQALRDGTKRGLITRSSLEDPGIEEPTKTQLNELLGRYD